MLDRFFSRVERTLFILGLRRPAMNSRQKPDTKNRFPTYATRLLFAGLLSCSAGAFSVQAATSISQFGITWTFDRDYQSGQFANGDYWVVGPVKIVSISPGSATSNGRTINGSMVNPGVGTNQGYDSAAYGGGYSGNVATGVSSSNPLTLAAGSSLVSSISHPTAGQRPQLTSAAVLTVLSSAAPAGSFRPPYVGTDKTPRWNVSQLKYSLLRSLPNVAGTPSLATLESQLERPWIEHNTEWTGRFIHPSENMPDYGRDMANVLGDALMSAHLNYTTEQKEKLVIRLVQYGIDVYGVAKAGAIWVDNGGHGHGRKMPLIFAGMMLGDGNMLALADGSKKIFQEDRQTWYVTTADVGRELYTGDGRPRVPYIAADVGLAEWGEKHMTQPNRDGRNWDAYYRNVVGHSILAHALVARLMGAQTHWKWPAFFDYTDRYWATEKATNTGLGNLIQPFVHAMWTTYRATAANSAAPVAEPITADPVTSDPTTPPASSASGRLVNVSVRSVARGDSSPLTVGFIVSGSERSVLVRSIGPSLAPYGVSGYLPNPRMTVYASGQPVGTNDNWAQTQRDAISAATTQTGAFALASTSLDSALTTKVAGARTVETVDTQGRSGVALVEVYDLGGEDSSRIVNFSARNHVGTGEQVLIAGFVVSGDSPKKLLIRGIGPGLKSYGVASPLADPRIEVHTTVQSGGASVDTIVASNDNWAQAGTSTLQSAFKATGAFALSDTASKDAAIVASLPAGTYTVALSGVAGGTGEGLIEIYEMP
jgi:hypothetical protein